MQIMQDQRYVRSNDELGKKITRHLFVQQKVVEAIIHRARCDKT